MEKKKKTINVSEADYQVMRRDIKAKRDIKRMVQELNNKVKSWK